MECVAPDCDAKHPMAMLFQLVGGQFRGRRGLRKPEHDRECAFDDTKRIAVMIEPACFRHLGGGIEWRETGNGGQAGRGLGRVRLAQGCGGPNCGINGIAAAFGAGKRSKSST